MSDMPKYHIHFQKPEPGTCLLCEVDRAEAAERQLTTANARVKELEDEKLTAKADAFEEVSGMLKDLGLNRFCDELRAKAEAIRKGREGGMKTRIFWMLLTIMWLLLLFVYIDGKQRKRYFKQGYDRGMAHSRNYFNKFGRLPDEEWADKNWNFINTNDGWIEIP